MNYMAMLSDVFYVVDLRDKYTIGAASWICLNSVQILLTVGLEYCGKEVNQVHSLLITFVMFKVCKQLLLSF